MINRILLFTLITVAMAACQSGTNTSSTKVVNVPQLLEVADKNVDKEIVVSGTVNHVCAHSGKRCFLIDETGELSIRVEADGEIESFGKELIGNEIKVIGFVRESRITTAEIDDWEKEIEANNTEKAENEGETCSAEMNNINSMRDWMKEHNKDYYAIYYVDGISYEKLD